MAEYKDFLAVFAPLIEINGVEIMGDQGVDDWIDIEEEKAGRNFFSGKLIGIKENNMNEQTAYKNEVVKGIDYKPTKKQGSFIWRLFCESNNMYSFFAPTTIKEQTPLGEIFATNTVTIGYRTREFNGKYYYDLVSIKRYLPADHQEPAIDAPLDPPPQTNQQQQLNQDGQPVYPQSNTTTPLPIQSNAQEPAFITEHTTPPPEQEETAIDDSDTPETPHQTMMADPTARAVIAAAIIDVFQQNGLYAKKNKTLEGKIMARIYGIIEAMDSLK